jgi:hypothetical protein
VSIIDRTPQIGVGNFFGHGVCRRREEAEMAIKEVTITAGNTRQRKTDAVMRKLLLVEKGAF